jgi:hypothetical protein
MRKQATNETLKIIGPHVMIREVKIQTKTMPFRRDSNRRDSRKPVMPVPTVQDRCLAAWGPSTTNQRLEHEAAFVGKNDATPGLTRVFLCAASLSFANLRWLVRRVLSPVVRAFGRSSPGRSRFARPVKDGNEQRSSCGSPRPLATVSREQCESHEPPASSSADGSTVDVLPGKALVADPVAACFSGLAGRLACRHLAISRRSHCEHPPSGPLRKCHGLPSTRQWHDNDAVPVLVPFLWVSCIVLSEHCDLFLYFFKEQ